MKIALDAGHGLYTSGKRCLKSIDPQETREWKLNSRIVDKLEEMLKNFNCEIIRVDDRTGATDVALSTRVKLANDKGADIYISVHHNAGVNGSTSGGTQVYYSSSAAARKVQATQLYSRLIEHTGLKGNRSETVINKGFYVIKNTKMPAFLIENGFMDSKTDVPIILSDSHATKTAEGILAFLKDFGLTAKTAVETPKAETTRPQTDNPKCPFNEPTYTLYRGRTPIDAIYVRWLQWQLNKYGYNLTTDGKFGPATDSALRDFQKHHNLTVDGKCGPATREELKK